MSKCGIIEYCSCSVKENITIFLFRRVHWVKIVAALNATGRIRAKLHIDELVNRFRVTVTAGDGTVSTPVTEVTPFSSYTALIHLFHRLLNDHVPSLFFTGVSISHSFATRAQPVLETFVMWFEANVDAVISLSHCAHPLVPSTLERPCSIIVLHRSKHFPFFRNSSVKSMSPSENKIILADLPSDIVRIIVKMEPQSTTSMRLEFEIDSKLLYSPNHFVHPSIASFFRKCMTIGRLEIDLILNVYHVSVDQIFATISQFPVLVLSFNVNHTVRGCIDAKILNLLRGGSVKKRLVLTAGMCIFRNNWMQNGLISNQKCGSFLFEAVRFVPEVEIISAANIFDTQLNERRVRVYWMEVVAELNATGSVRAVLNIDELINQFRDALTLADLPSDIIRIIAEMEPQLITRMRLIAPSWCMPISIIKRLYWRIDSDGHLMTLNIASSSLDYFDIDEWYHRSVIINSDTEAEVKVNTPRLFSRDQFVPPSIPSLFSKCKAIGRLEIHLTRPRKEIEIDAIFAAISGIPVQELHVSKIITFLRICKIKKRLVLKEDICDFDNYWMRKGVNSVQTCGPQFLSEAVRFVPEVKIAIAGQMSRTRIKERLIHWVQVVSALNTTGRVRAVLHIDDNTNRSWITVAASEVKAYGHAGRFAMLVCMAISMLLVFWSVTLSMITYN
ncbi:hypothetical protein PRIPAC_90465 [Pristionchus pacificus]|uniref:Uncharacterized protein n=1 Tax=Pristionchus pacificus TaxID=54126 RepID=A0A2A6B9N9_PRIPA|nr:hypothetical protein PRIPAC_90465 [Pristionchus pacificus]|eukprot:PDM62602.1 hypothetical protein PRIPAC_52044 [Pristionchus pacificus]